MNEFLQQFVIESRDQVEQATEGLLVLEQSPRNAERLDAVFRSFHTIKGGAGIVEFAAMERAVHAAEDVLSAARAGKQPLTAVRVGDCLTCLDQVLQWLDTIEQTGELPANADAQANRVIERFGVGNAPAQATSTKLESAEDWITALFDRHPTARDRAATAIRFVPDSECFYRGEDPLARFASMQNLLAFDVQPREAWPPLDAFDPFKCNLVLTALTAASVSEVSAQMHGHSGECEIRATDSETPAMSHSPLPPRARDILEAQIALLKESQPRTLAGRVASAGRTAANIARHLGQIGSMEALTQATEKSLADRTPQALTDAITRLLASEVATASEAAEPSTRVDFAARTLRIDAEKIDALVRLTGELTVAKNAVGHVVKLAQMDGNAIAGVLKDRHGVLEHLIGELQRSVLEMRMLPLRVVLQRFPRVLREMSATLGKNVRLEIEGDETEADKAIVEMLFEPLLHVVRNAIDHGVDSPQLRANRGKPSAAVIRIRAQRQGAQVLIEVSDDGGGVDLDRVRKVALDRGMVTAESLRTLPDADVIDLVFAPGFSTASQVTEISGRGVGMDAVRTAVERVGGRVSIESRALHGTSVRFSLPFSVMMTHVMTVEATGQMFGIPLDAVVETVRVPQADIAAVGAAQAIVLRDRTIPVLTLASVLGATTAVLDEGDVTIVITAVAGQLCGIRVDRVGERMEVILKPLEGLLSGTPGITGTTLLGDGRVLLVLDIGEMLQ